MSLGAMRECDLAIVGAGVAGLTAATAAARAGLSVLVIERMGAGGQVMTVDHVANFPAYPDGIAGFDLGPALQEQAEDAGAQFALDNVERIEPGEARHVLHCAGEPVAARAVLLAVGSQRRKLGVPGEDEYEGRGVSHCASCDGPLFRGESVCVVGGGDSALGEAAVLAQLAAQVHVVFAGAAPHAQPYLTDAVMGLANVTLMPGVRVQALTGGECGVDGVVLQGGAGLPTTLPVTGLFVYAGLVPGTSFLHGTLALDGDGRIQADAALQTSVPGIFAAGDVRAGAAYLLSQAAQDGTQAAQAAIRYLEGDTP